MEPEVRQQRHRYRHSGRPLQHTLAMQPSPASTPAVQPAYWFANFLHQRGPMGSDKAQLGGRWRWRRFESALLEKAPLRPLLEAAPAPPPPPPH